MLVPKGKEYFPKEYTDKATSDPKISLLSAGVIFKIFTTIYIY